MVLKLSGLTVISPASIMGAAQPKSWGQHYSPSNLWRIEQAIEDLHHLSKKHIIEPKDKDTHLHAIMSATRFNPSYL
jgi:hypothetical protein